MRTEIFASVLEARDNIHLIKGVEENIYDIISIINDGVWDFGFGRMAGFI